jgi:CheY-like chemotaxis protein
MVPLGVGRFETTPPGVRAIDVASAAGAAVQCHETLQAPERALRRSVPKWIPRRAPVAEPRSDWSKQILVVDDDPVILDVISKTMEQLGFVTQRASNGEEGWNAISSSGAGFDLVITDNEMPRLTGVNMIKRLREVSAHPPCLLISASLESRESSLRSCIRPGALLAKPFSSAELVEIVYTLLLHGDCEPT